MTRGYVGRLAPSPTGLLHLGHAATFFVTFRRARAVGGRLFLRWDDLDRQRSKDAYVLAAKEDLRWLGVGWDGEWRESERLGSYRGAMGRLLETGLIFPCSCSRKDLLQAVQAPHEDVDDEPVYGGRCRPNGQNLGVKSASETGFSGDKALFSEVTRTGEENRAAGEGFAAGWEATNWRFRVPEGESVSFVDGNFGPQCFVAGVDFGDFLVWRKDGLPSYQLASVTDDAEMGVTEVVRGRDLLKSTARQILLQRALGLKTPAYFHTELLRDEQGQRLAKRHDALSLRALRERGVTPEKVLAGLLTEKDA